MTQVIITKTDQFQTIIILIVCLNLNQCTMNQGKFIYDIVKLEKIVHNTWLLFLVLMPVIDLMKCLIFIINHHYMMKTYLHITLSVVYSHDYIINLIKNLAI